MPNKFLADHLFQFNVGIGARTEQFKADAMNSKAADVFIIDGRAKMGLKTDLVKIGRLQELFFEELSIRRPAVSLFSDAHINAWKWRQARVTAKDKSPERPYEPPRLRNIADINAAIYKRSHRTPARTIVAEHRAAHRAMQRALRAAPADYFAKRHSAQWPFDAVGHVAEHRRKHLEPLLLARAAKASRAR